MSFKRSMKHLLLISVIASIYSIQLLSYVHLFIVLKHDNGKIVILLGDQHALGTKEQNIDQLNQFHELLISNFALQDVSAQILLEHEDSLTPIGRKVFLDGSYTDKRYWNILKSINYDDTIIVGRYETDKVNVNERESLNGRKPHTTWIFDDFVSRYNRFRGAPKIEIIGCDYRYIRSLSSLYMQTIKQQEDDTYSYAELLKAGVQAFMIRKRVNKNNTAVSESSRMRQHV